jgi:hypothetical protein
MDMVGEYLLAPGTAFALKSISGLTMALGGSLTGYGSKPDAGPDESHFSCTQRWALSDSVADNSIGGLFGKFLLWECEYRPMRKSTSDLIWDFIVLCNERKAVKKLRENIRRE